MPPIGNFFAVSVPFSIALSVQLSDCPTCLTRNTIILAAGAGDAIFAFAPFPGRREWQPTGAFYKITTPLNPVPEHSTWLLVPTAGGLAWLARRNRRATT